MFADVLYRNIKIIVGNVKDKFKIFVCVYACQWLCVAYTIITLDNFG